MSSYIFQLSASKLNQEDYFDESRYFCDSCSWFVGAIAEYVSEVSGDQRKTLLDTEEFLFADCINICKTENNDYFLVVNNKKDFIKSLFSEVSAKCEEVSKNYEERNSSAIWEISNLLNPKYDMYFDSTEYGLCTINRFIEEAEEGVPYYIGNIFFYK